MLKFTKMNGAGNDFVMLDNREGRINLGREEIARLCDRHRGVGGDGLILAEPAADGADFRMRYYNSDGGEAEMCGNGARCFARFARRLTGKDEVRFETIAGLITARVRGDDIELDMGSPRDLRMEEQLDAGDRRLTVHSVNTGVPHAVVFVEQLDTFPVAEIGAAIRYHEHFAPKGTNANFVEHRGQGELAIRTYERGVEGETLACGTGVVAAALIFHELHGGKPPIRVRVRGGDDLSVGFRRSNGTYRDVTLTGPADIVFEGELSD